MKYFKIIILLTTLFFVSNCSDFKSAMTGQNKKTTDEFLVKKKDPLILPPQFEKLPVPNSKQTKASNPVKSAFENASESEKNNKISSDLETMILKELRKKN